MKPEPGAAVTPGPNTGSISVFMVNDGEMYLKDNEGTVYPLDAVPEAFELLRRQVASPRGMSIALLGRMLILLARVEP